MIRRFRTSTNVILFSSSRGPEISSPSPFQFEDDRTPGAIATTLQAHSGVEELVAAIHFGLQSSSPHPSGRVNSVRWMDLRFAASSQERLPSRLHRVLVSAAADNNAIVWIPAETEMQVGFYHHEMYFRDFPHSMRRIYSISSGPATLCSLRTHNPSHSLSLPSVLTKRSW